MNISSQITVVGWNNLIILVILMEDENHLLLNRFKFYEDYFKHTGM